MTKKERRSLKRHYERKKEWHIKEMERTGNRAHLFYIVECDEKIRELEEEKMEKAHDNINHPKHYTYGEHEVIDVIEDWNMNYHLGNAIKYIARCEHKENKIDDLKKAIWYLNREIEREEQR